MLVTDHLTLNPTGSVFQPVGAGNYYLAPNSACAFAGTTNISPRLLAELRRKTTQPPIALPPLMQLEGELALSPQARRYAGGPPDLGYYYDPLDYTVAWLASWGRITILPGTAIGFRDEYSPALDDWTRWGFDLREGSIFVSQGTPTNPIIFTDAQLVQEQFQYACLASFVPDFWPTDAGAPPPSLDFRFSNFYASPTRYHLWSGYDEGFYYLLAPDSLMNWSMRDCNLHGGRINLGPPDDGNYGAPMDYFYGSGAVSWYNNLFENVSITLDPTYYWMIGAMNCDLSFQAANNLFRDGDWFVLEPIPASAGNWALYDNLFDKVEFFQDTNQFLAFDYNGYWPRTSSELRWSDDASQLLPTSAGTPAHEAVLGTPPLYQRGPLGDYYLPVTTPLYHVGSRPATDAGLFHYTTRVDQTKEGSGQAVSVGLHYVAVTNGAPTDSDGDGIPDYLENWHGDANFASHTDSETDWQTQYTAAGVFDPTNSVYDDIDLSGNGLVGRVKKAFGMSPFDASNPLTLTQATVATDPGIVTFQLPITYGLIDHTSSNSVGKVDLLMDGTPLSVGCEPDTNGLCLIHWEINFSPPGFHMLQAQFILSHILTSGPDPDPTVITAPGIPIAYTADTGIQFDPFYSQFDDAHGAVLYATTPTCSDATYSIELQTTNGTHIKTIDGTTSNGEISEPWDLTDDQGHTITNDSVNAVFNVTLLDPGSYTATFNLNRVADRYLPVDGAFTIAYGADHVADEQDLHDCLQLTVVDQLIGPCNATFCYDHPYTSTFNAWSALGTIPGNPGHLAYQSDCDALLANLANTSIFGELTKNFYYFGHASPNNLGTMDYLFFNTKDVADRLENHDFTYYGPGRHTPGKHRFGQAYRLVFLDGCATAMDADWAHAFGVYDRITTKQLANWPEQVQAFVGWDNLKKAPGSGNNFNMANCYSVFWSAWQSGLPLDRCIWFASQHHPPAPLNFMDLSNYNFGPRYQHWNAYYRWKYGLTGDARIKLYGYAGITRTGYVPGYDNSPYHK